jgi:hypothetical protein
MSNVTTYQQVTTSTIEALRASNNAENKLQQAGENVRAFYVTREAFREVKKQFEADAIIPALDKKYQQALAYTIERADKSEQADVLRKAKATARGFVASYFSKIENHAFPKDKVEATPREPSLAFVEDLIKVAKKGQKLESASFNLIKVMAHLNNALKEIGVSAEAEADEM